MASDRAWRWATAAFWVAAGANHFRAPVFYEAIVPPPLDRWKREVSAVAGVAELAGGLAVVPKGTRRRARWWLLATLLAVYPANIYMALKPERYPKFRKELLWARLPVQGLFAWFSWRGTR
jgi:uncharacterized membrane protein